MTPYTGRRLLSAFAAACILLPALSCGAFAHVGERYLDQRIDIRLLRSGAEIRYSLFPSPLYRASLVPEMDSDGDRRVRVEERRAYYGGLAPEIVKNVELLLDGSPLELEEEGAPPESGDPCEVVFLFRAAFPPLSAGEHTISVTSGAFGDDTRRLGFRFEPAEEGVLFLSGESGEREAGYVFRVEGGAGPSAPPARGREALPGREDPFDLDSAVSRIFQEGSVFRRIMLALAVLAVGFLHAIGPGHGKTIAGLYLAGSKSTVKDAVLLSFLITFFHIVAVVVLTLAFYFFSTVLVSNEYYYPAVRLLSGVIVAVIGACMLVSSLRKGVSRHYHSNGGGDGHEHDHGFSRLFEGERRMSFPSMVGLSFSCGIVPCSAGFIIMLTAISLGRVALGALVLLLFALGVFAAILLVSLSVVQGKLLFRGTRGHRFAYHWLPRISAVLISALGVYLIVTALG